MIAFDGYFSNYLIKKLKFFVFFVLFFNEIVLNDSYKITRVPKKFNYNSFNSLNEKSDNFYSKKLIDLKKDENIDENYYEEDLLKRKKEKNLDNVYKRNYDNEDNEENIKVYKDEGVKNYEQEEIDKLRKDEINQLKEKNEEELLNEEDNELNSSLENEKTINSLMKEQNKVDEFNSKERKIEHDHSIRSFFDFNKQNKYQTKDNDLETFDSSQKSIEYEKKDEYDKLIIELLKKRYLKNQKQPDVFEKTNYKSNLEDEDLFKFNPEKIKYEVLEKKINNLINLLEEQRNLNELNLKKKNLNIDKSIDKNKKILSDQKFPNNYHPSLNRLRFFKNFDNQAKSALNYLFENNIINTPYLGQQKFPIFKLIKSEDQTLNSYPRKIDSFKTNFLNKINNPINLYSNLFDTRNFLGITPSIHNQALQKLPPNRFFWHPLNQLSPSIPLRLQSINKDRSTKILRFPNYVGAHFTGYRQF